MAKKQTFGDKVGKGKKRSAAEINFFGTRQDMVVKEITEGDQVVQLIAKDDQGYYITYPEYVESGLADPNRYGADRTEPTGYEGELESAEQAE